MAEWRSELNGLMGGRGRLTRAEQENAEFEDFLDAVALPSLSEVAEELSGKHGRDAQVRRAPASVTLCVRAGEVEEITFRVMKQFVQNGILPRAEVRINRGTRFVKYDSMFKEDPQNYPITDVTADEIIGCFIRYYKMAMSSVQSGAAE
ncbi:MAG: hypothetical protein PHG96_06015 [Kiritimatiellae bacterium]|nr:hypothetical protein [Kiritimatiellia bacterium]MDD3544899.1 hypothetical protein [Kiritimatiellia bacterium]MDD4024452.1 hypothetical protein [Kiritimatiellia bacterium]MDD4622036.1 hypothetical protein [Kiritimatiellia bacterium]